MEGKGGHLCPFDTFLVFISCILRYQTFTFNWSTSIVCGDFNLSNSREGWYLCSLVSTFNFSLQEKFKAIFEATFTHSKNLAAFVFLYKSMTGLMEHFQQEKMQIHSFIAAFIGGYFVFGKYNKVNEQVWVFYVYILSIKKQQIIIISHFISESINLNWVW